jgi:hypothetical protein
LDILQEDPSDFYTVEAILNRRRRSNKIQYLVKWQNYPEHDASWEPKAALKATISLLLEQYDAAHPFLRRRRRRQL